LLKENSSFYIYVTLILQRYMKCIVGHSFQKLIEVKGFEYFQHTNQSARQTSSTPINQHTNQSADTINNCMMFSQVLLNGRVTCTHNG
jgi:hypothetical protein